MPHVLVTPATLLAVSVDEAKCYLYEPPDTENAFIASLIREGQQFLEDRYHIAIGLQTWRLTMDGWRDCRHFVDGAIRVPRPPFGAITSFDYVDNDGTSTPLASTEYRLESDSQFARIEEAYNVSWPTTRGVAGDVVLVHTCGYASAADVPNTTKAAIKDYANFKYWNRACPLSDQLLHQFDTLMTRQRSFQYA